MQIRPSLFWCVAFLMACGGGDEPTLSGPAETEPEPAADAAEEAPAEASAEEAPAAAASEEGTGDDDDADDEPPADGPSVMVDEKTGFGINSSSVPTAEGTVMGGINAFCEPDDANKVRWGGNNSPHLSWGPVPVGTKSFALLMYDPDVPASPERVNQDTMSIPVEAERTTFYHWVLVDIPAARTELPADAEGKGVTEGGKPLETNQYGKRGLNDFTAWFADDAKLKGDYAGYDGPCPPWNDLRKHRYVFEMNALDVEKLDLGTRFTGKDVVAAMKGHVLAKASFTTVYWINPAIVAPPAK